MGRDLAVKMGCLSAERAIEMVKNKALDDEGKALRVRIREAMEELWVWPEVI
jgi:hypothetical protein